MTDPYIVGTLDITELVFLAFVLFFIALIFYLRREDRREGYPLEDEMTGRIDTPGGPLSRASPKLFKLPFGQGIYIPEHAERDRRTIPAKPAFGGAGAPYVPTGDPLLDGLGPAAWANRQPVPDVDLHGRPRIVPLRLDSHIAIAARDPNPVGMTVLGADGLVAGKVSEVWIDRSEQIIRYLEILTPGGVSVLAPMTMALVKKSKGVIVIDALNAADFAAAPPLASPDQITRYEEERIVAYFGGGYLYATPERQEPLL